MSVTRECNDMVLRLREATNCYNICQTTNSRHYGWPRQEVILGIWEGFRLLKGISFTDALELEKNGKLLEWFETEIAISKMKE